MGRYEQAATDLDPSEERKACHNLNVAADNDGDAEL
jgi:hypothetical protein